MKTMKFIIRIIFTSVVLLSLIGCGLSTCPYYSDLEVIEDEIEKDNLIGIYKLDIDPPASVGPGELILKNNSDFILKNIPVGLLDVFNSDYSQDSETINDINGNWNLVANTNEPTISVELKFNEIDESLDNTTSTWNLYEKDGTRVILIILGDPDSCEALRFIKKT